MVVEADGTANSLTVGLQYLVYVFKPPDFRGYINCMGFMQCASGSTDFMHPLIEMPCLDER